MLEALNILIVLLLVFANGFFVASEFALVGVRRSRIAALAGSGDPRAKRLLRQVDNLNAYISATQLGITLASLALGWIGEPAIARMIEGPLSGRVSDAVLHTISFTIAFGIITFLHIVLGELAPKTVALERAEKTALAIALPMEIFYRVFYWPIRMLDWAGTRTVRLFGLRTSPDHGSIYTEDEIRHLIDASRKSGHIGEGEQKLIDRVFILLIAITDKLKLIAETGGLYEPHLAADDLQSRKRCDEGLYSLQESCGVPAKEKGPVL